MSFLYEFFFVFFFFKQKTAYEMRISDWSSDVCSSDLQRSKRDDVDGVDRLKHRCRYFIAQYISVHLPIGVQVDRRSRLLKERPEENGTQNQEHGGKDPRSEEHTSELQSLMRISYAVFCLKKKTTNTKTHIKSKTHNTTQHK